MELTGQYGQLEILVLGTLPTALAAALAMYAAIAIGFSSQVLHAYAHIPASQVPCAVRWATQTSR